MLRYLLAWFPMILLAILNGSLRDLVYKPYVGELPAHQISTISLLLLLSGYIWLVLYWMPLVSVNQAVMTGLMWMLLTLGFEFGFGLFRGRSWTDLLADYRIQDGRIWVLIPAWIGLAPYLFYVLNK